MRQWVGRDRGREKEVLEGVAAQQLVLRQRLRRWVVTETGTGTMMRPRLLTMTMTMETGTMIKGREVAMVRAMATRRSWREQRQGQGQRGLISSSSESTM
jgi:hypothetical protein